MSAVQRPAGAGMPLDAPHDQVIIRAAGVGRNILGAAAAGVVILDAETGDSLCWANYRLHNLATKQMAEYLAIGLGLRKGSELGATHAVVQIDSGVVVGGMTNRVPRKQGRAWALRAIAKEYAKRLRDVTYGSITTEQNVQAAWLADQALRGRAATRPPVDLAAAVRSSSEDGAA